MDTPVKCRQRQLNKKQQKKGINMFKDIVEFGFPTNIVFGAGALKRVPGALSAQKAVRPMVITDASFVSTEAFQQAADVFKQADMGFEVFSEISSEIDAAAACFKEKGCDSIIGLGGGSALDAAKALAVVAANTGKAADFDASAGGGKKIRGPLPPLIAVPTTSGTGSEVGRCSVISSAGNGIKFMVCHPLMMPGLAVLDPDLTVGLPPFLTAATGMDAFSHCLESLVSPVFHPMCDAIAVKGIQLVACYLETAFQHPRNIEARGYMQLASMMGAVAFQKDLGATHSIAHALSAVCNMHHGLANAICLAPVMTYNMDTSATQYAQVASLFGVDTRGLTDAAAAQKAVTCVTDIVSKLGLPETLSRAGVEESRLPELASLAYKDPCHQSNPRPCSEADLLAILRQAY
jgi:alcohol dehydrogenase class IV